MVNFQMSQHIFNEPLLTIHHYSFISFFFNKNKNLEKFEVSCWALLVVAVCCRQLLMSSSGLLFIIIEYLTIKDCEFNIVV